MAFYNVVKFKSKWWKLSFRFTNGLKVIWDLPTFSSTSYRIFPFTGIKAAEKNPAKILIWKDDFMYDIIKHLTSIAPSQVRIHPLFDEGSYVFTRDVGDGLEEGVSWQKHLTPHLTLVLLGWSCAGQAQKLVKNLPRTKKNKKIE